MPLARCGRGRASTVEAQTQRPRHRGLGSNDGRCRPHADRPGRPRAGASSRGAPYPPPRAPASSAALDTAPDLAWMATRLANTPDAFHGPEPLGLGRGGSGRVREWCRAPFGETSPKLTGRSTAEDRCGEGHRDACPA